MNGNDLKNAVAEKTGMTKADSGRIIEAVFGTIQEELVQGKDVRLIGFGSFETAERKESTGRNPRTGDAIVIPAQTQVKFRPGKGLKTKINAD